MISSADIDALDSESELNIRTRSQVFCQLAQKVGVMMPLRQVSRMRLSGCSQVVCADCGVKHELDWCSDISAVCAPS